MALSSIFNEPHDALDRRAIGPRKHRCSGWKEAMGTGKTPLCSINADTTPSRLRAAVQLDSGRRLAYRRRCPDLCRNICRVWEKRIAEGTAGL
jgi:hypothetical protein